MPSWSSRILSPTLGNHVESPTTIRPRPGGEAEGQFSTSLHDVPTLLSPNTLSLHHSRSGSSHRRAVSQPFPSPLDVDKRRTLSGSTVSRNGSVPTVNTSGAANHAVSQIMHDKRDPAGQSQKSPSKHGKDGLRTGNCMTCDLTVRWPRQLDVYRCTNCLMINDLKPAGKEMHGAVQQTGESGIRVSRKAVPLSLERTRKIAEQCVIQYLDQKADEIRGIRQPARKDSISKRPETTQHNRQASGSRQDLTSYLPATAEPSLDSRQKPRSVTLSTRTASHGPSRSNSIPEKERPAWKEVFAPFEDHLLSSLQTCDTLNASFALVRPSTARVSSDASHTTRKQRQQEDAALEEEAVFEIDPKLLLVGDIGENGQWWTGESHGSTHKPRKDENIDKRPSRFDWTNIYAWYDVVLGCGRDWQHQLSQLDIEAQQALQGHEEEIDYLLGQGRHHVRRTLLKGIENLLRRPTRPLQTPDDMRFLVIMMANPQLYPDSTGSGIKRAGSIAYPGTSRSSSTASGNHSKPQGVANGHHAGIIKRILGLLANLPLSCHQALIAWFCRVSEVQFHDMVELVGGFVSYRLARQKARSKANVDFTAGLIPDLSGPGGGTSAHLHAAIGESAKASKKDKAEEEQAYRDDWQIKTAAKVMSLLFAANMFPRASRYDPNRNQGQSTVHQRAKGHFQLLPTNFFYNTRLDYVDLVGDFEAWESRRGKFSFCQYPMFLSIWAKIKILEHDARRQMEIKARDAFFTTIMKGKAVSQFLVFNVRRECLVEDSLRNVSEVTGTISEEIKKSLKIRFIGEEGIDAGGLRKEWFLLLTREVFDPEHGLFVYDSDSNYCYFNPFSFETSDQFFLIGVLLGLAIYNSTILDVSLPPFAFRKLLASAPIYTGPNTTATRPSPTYTLSDLAEWKPALARGLQQLLDHEGDDVEDVFCRDFVIEVDRYGEILRIPLCPGGEKKAVTNANRKEFVDLYIRWLLDISIARQYEPFKRGFFSVCGGNALSLFRPEEIELLIRGSDESLDIASLRGVATYENCRPTDNHVVWFWEILEAAEPKYQREILAFITGSDRIPAMGATSLVIKIVCVSEDTSRYPVARTCFNILGLRPYGSKGELEGKLWRAVRESEGFGLK